MGYIGRSPTAALSSSLLQDADANTKVQVEESTNENIIRFDTAGAERMIMTANGNPAVHIKDATRELKIGTSGYVLANDGGALLFRSNSDTERLRILDAGGLTFNGDTADANALDDYEEGSFTPTFSSTSASFSYGTQSGEYIKIGRVVHLFFRIALNSSPTGTLSNTTFIAGLPFTIDSTAHYAGGSVGHYFQFNKTSTDEEIVLQSISGGSTLELKLVGDNMGEASLTPAQMNSTAQIRTTFTYLT